MDTLYLKNNTNLFKYKYLHLTQFNINHSQSFINMFMLTKSM